MLGASLLANASKPVAANILLSHTHWDHIQGFPFFAPLFIPGNEITVSGPQGAKGSLPEVLSGQMEFTYFPVELEQLGAKITYRDLNEGTHEIDGVRVTAQFLNHPAIALGYRIEADGGSLLYLCDHEPYWESLWRSDSPAGQMDSILHEGDRRHAAFMENADVVIHDAQYTSEEYPAKKNWGHSTYSYVTQMAAAANVKRLFLTHHDPMHADDFLDGVQQRARDLAASIGSGIRISCAAEGYEENVITGLGRHAAINAVADAESASNNELSVLVIDDDEDLRLLVRRALSKLGHTVSEAADGKEGLRAIARKRPDLVLLDLFMPPPDGFEVLKSLRADPDLQYLPVVVLTAHGDEESARASFDMGATDFLAKPFTPPQLDARVRSCFARAQAARS